MDEFLPAELPQEAFDVDAMMSRFGVTRQEAESLVRYSMSQSVVMNSEYQVNIRKAELASPLGSWPEMLHLSIKRRDKSPIHDWRVLQEIKNKVCGPEFEAVELYPAESRLTDTANQYHLFVLKEEGLKFPFGFFGDRNVSSPEEVERFGAVQRARGEL